MGKLYVIGEGKEVTIGFGDKYEPVLLFVIWFIFILFVAWSVSVVPNYFN